MPTYRRLCLPLLWLQAGTPEEQLQPSGPGQLDRPRQNLTLCLVRTAGGWAGSAIAEHQSTSPARSYNIGFGLAITFGALKEAWDSRPNGTGWSWKDFTWDVAGAAAGIQLYALSN